MEYEVVRNVTLPLLRVPDDGTPIFIKLLCEIFTAAVVEGSRKPRSDGGPQTPPEIIHVLNLSNGIESQMIVSSVLGSELRAAYPAAGYVGKSFRVLKFKPTGNKRYATFEIAEIAAKKETAKAAKN